MRSGLVPPRCHVCPVRAAQSASWGRLGPRGGAGCARTTACRAGPARRERPRGPRTRPQRPHSAPGGARRLGCAAGAPGRVPCGARRRASRNRALVSKRRERDRTGQRAIDAYRVPLSVTIILNLTVRPAPTNCVPATGTRCAGRSAANPHRTIVCECVANRNDCGVVQNLAVSSSPFTARAGSAHWRLWW